MKTILAILAAVCLVGCDGPEVIDAQNKEHIQNRKLIGELPDGGKLYYMLFRVNSGHSIETTYVEYPKPKVTPPMPTPMPTYYRQTNVIVDGKPAFIQETFQGPQQ